MHRPSSGWTARLISAAFALTLILGASTALAATDFTVNTLGDAGDGVCDATCTLRDAVGSLTTGNDDRVIFDFSALTAPFEIVLETTLEIDSSRVEVTGLVCSGCGGTNGNGNAAADGFSSTLAVRIVAGSGLVGSNPLILVTGNSVLLTGLNIDAGPDVGIHIVDTVSTQSLPTVISDCYIGTNILGAAGVGNGSHGIFVDDSSWVTVGPGVIASNNDGDGIRYAGGACDNLTVTGTIAGLDRSASVAVANTDSGVHIEALAGLISAGTVGGTTASLGNVLSANGLDGIRISGEISGGSGYDFEITNNIIGSDGGVTVDLGNDSDGIAVIAQTNEIPRQFIIADNTIVANDGAGMHLFSARLLEITGNAIGTDASGTLDLGNGGDGISLLAGNPDQGEDIVIGGTGAENLIAHNGGDGIRMERQGNKAVRRNDVLANAIWDNAGLGIDLRAVSAGTGPSLPLAGTCTRDDSYGNSGLGAPSVTNASLAAGILTVNGTVCDDMEVDVYLASGGAAVNGQPMLFLGTVQGGSCDGGSYANCAATFGDTFAITAGEGVGGGAYVTAIARDASEPETTEAAVNGLIVAPCDSDGDGADVNNGSSCTGPDCDDGDATVYPSAPELCDAIDNDCDASTDEDFDVDGDGSTTCGVDGDTNTTADNDCDDSDNTIFPGATETCDAVDQDCDTVIDNGFDLDSDGITTCGLDGDLSLTTDNDCDDTVATTYPGATELCNDVDDDCDGAPATDEVDTDNDGEMVCAGDCDDAAFAVNTSATEVCNIIDDDCDTDVDEGFDVDTDTVTTCGADGVVGTSDDDCDDGDAAVLPGATESCNQVDDDCDGNTDEDFDADGDGYPSGVNCTAAWGDQVDCDEGNAAVNPGALELCDTIDNDCDGEIDEDEDLDLDTYTNCDGDCDDSDPAINPGATEVCDGADTDCDGTIPADETDDDGDGFNECAGLDCDDTAAAIYPGATEICDGADSDCDGDTPTDETDDDGDGLNECGDNDCDDGDATIGPGLTELCDGIDNDCDGAIPDDELDDDEDFFSECEGDCDDSTEDIGPTVPEVCDGIDQNCVGGIDDGFDADADGVTTCGDDGTEGTADDDCDDGDATVNPTADEICEDSIDQDCDGADAACAATADVTLGVVPPPKKGCSASVAGGGGVNAGLLMGLGLMLGFRRRRRSLQLAPLLGVVLLAGCVSIDAGVVQTWWGALPEDGGAVTLEAGGSFAAGAMVQPIDPELVGGRTLLQVILAGDLLPGNCGRQNALFEEAMSVEEAVIDSVAAGAASADLAGWACQELRGAAREAFGGEGWRAVHALVDVGDGTLTPATGSGELLEALAEGTYMARLVDLGGRSALAPTPEDEACATRVQALLDSGEAITEGALLGAALARRAHKAPADDQLARAGDGAELAVGLVLLGGLEAGSRPDSVSLTTFVGDEAETFPDVVVSTVGEPIVTEPCGQSPNRDIVSIWPELAPEVVQ